MSSARQTVTSGWRTMKRYRVELASGGAGLGRDRHPGRAGRSGGRGGTGPLPRQLGPSQGAERPGDAARPPNADVLDRRATASMGLYFSTLLYAVRARFASPAAS